MINDIVIVKEMGLSHREFFRTIASALGSDQFERWDARVLLTTRDLILNIELGVESERRIALMVVPRTIVTLRFKNYTQTQADVAIKRFDMVFKRGGG
jgi:hypothetical protein